MTFKIVAKCRYMSSTVSVTSRPMRYFYVWSVYDFIRRIYSVADNVRILTEWYEKRNDDPPSVLRDIRSGTMYRERFLARYSESKYNICVSISADGVQKSALTDKTVFPVMMRVESTAINVKVDDNLQHLSVLCPGNYTNLNNFLGFLSAELRVLGERGIQVDIAGIGVRTVRVSTILLGGDLRALSSLAGKWRDPAIHHACPNCDIIGVRHGPKRTVYQESKRQAASYSDGDALGPKFKQIPVLGYGIHHIEETLAICFAHNVKNGVQRIFGMHGDVGSPKFTQELRCLELRGRFLADIPWLTNPQEMNTFEVRILHAIWGHKPKSPFQNKKGVSVSDQKKREIYPGMTGLRQDRRMIDYIRMLRSGLCELALQVTVPAQYATVTVGLLRAISRCLKDSIHVSELESMKVMIDIINVSIIHIMELMGI